MDFVGRSAELGRLRAALDRRDGAVIRVTGVRGAGKTALARQVVRHHRHLLYQAPALPDQAQRVAFLQLLLSKGEDSRDPPLTGVAATDPDTSPLSGAWSDMLDRALGLLRAETGPVVIVFDDVHRLGEARSRYLEGVLHAVERAREGGHTLHVLLVGPERAMPGDETLPSDSPEPLRVGPLPFRYACALLPGTRPAELVRAYGVFGGLPKVLTTLDRDVTVGTNVRRLVLSANAALRDAGGVWLERDVQTPARYYAILATIARGEADWSAVHAGVPDLTRSGQVAPYLKRLEELGLIVARRSLDAAPNARARRYAIADPFIAFWMRFGFPTLSVERPAEASDGYSNRVRPALDAHLAGVFPLICRQHMERNSIETLGASVRECGSLWGTGYDVAVAGVLTSGAVFYGTCHWTRPTEDEGPLEALDRELKETRYGFGRERRVRLVFTSTDTPRWLQREIARRHDAELVDAAALVGER